MHHFDTPIHLTGLRCSSLGCWDVILFVYFVIFRQNPDDTCVLVRQCDCSSIFVTLRYQLAQPAVRFGIFLSKADIRSR
jgi:hypothetical protein